MGRPEFSRGMLKKTSQRGHARACFDLRGAIMSDRKGRGHLCGLVIRRAVGGAERMSEAKGQGRAALAPLRSGKIGGQLVEGT